MTSLSFDQLGLHPTILQTVTDIGYETPSPIQAQSIPPLLSGQDILGQAQTGSGKTAAFALPLLSRLEPKNKNVQVLILTPTRELAMQVSAAIQNYGRDLKTLKIATIYGGAAYDKQIRDLRNGANIVVGTPGRVMDHIKKGTLKIGELKTLVLDEADEMLRMGFIDDVEWILEHTPDNRQIALYSATMPAQIKKVTEKYLVDYAHIKIQQKTATATSIKQRVWMVRGYNKLDALSRILEVEDYQAVIIFVRTKAATEELAMQLNKRGISAEPLNGDMSQAQREKTVDRLRKGGVNGISILIGTDVVARGLDVPRISHVINYDIPFDTESYIHRIGRTGRAGSEGHAILFAAPRETRMLKSIERATRQPIDVMDLPTVEEINAKRIKVFKEEIKKALEEKDLDIYTTVIKEFQEENPCEPQELMAALAKMNHKGRPFLLNKQLDNIKSTRGVSEDKKGRMGGKAIPLRDNPNVKMVRYKVQVGYKDGLRPGTLVGAVANESGISGRMIGHIEIFTTFSTIDLPSSVDKDALDKISNAKIRGRFLNIAPFTEKPPTRHRGGGSFKKKDKKSFGHKKHNNAGAPPTRGKHFKKK